MAAVRIAVEQLVSGAPASDVISQITGTGEKPLFASSVSLSLSFMLSVMLFLLCIGFKKMEESDSQTKRIVHQI